MANNPLWVNANQASQLALKTSFLKTMVLVLQRPGSECECQRTPSQKSLFMCYPGGGDTDRDATVKATGAERQSLR